ncbi:hypothetical protein METBIDRAFT_182818 [Metschnikowia bicuspidata var. bicuspidata NRRL YB-4993]|uniref:Uncharacterized protein n=1 Tax=Metschnikowia bicuspidata var. bicuspidata NRRL YB-4993 TaxID=869754 RepID=A0A1A0HBP5_9ASCO|nr:hypothetical protein METBIDRAFT_182818 [Metschnikowia bicuspidata var. bicuspidata NRRL YB-4993]OBA21405.1 hypothetical protein METBIDRAFT_182818 [Metschnikowia bicuspidata var. bicuspidata NRRL YB-4993]
MVNLLGLLAAVYSVVLCRCVLRWSYAEVYFGDLLILVCFDLFPMVYLGTLVVICHQWSAVVERNHRCTGHGLGSPFILPDMGARSISMQNRKKIPGRPKADVPWCRNVHIMY